jgi:hypothetical protein
MLPTGTLSAESEAQPQLRQQQEVALVSVLTSSQMPTITTESVVRRLRSLRGVGFVLGVYVLTRVFAVVVVVIAGKHQIGVPAPGYWTIETNWDGQWYSTIANHGYPIDLPRDATGHVTANAWAFYPLFPMLARGLMWLTGLSFTVVGPAISVVLGAVAVVVLFRLVLDALGATAASMATVLTCTFMSAPVLQAAYTESLALLLVSSFLLLLRRRRYAWTAFVIVLLALSRNVVLAMAPVILLHGAVRYRARAENEFTARDRLTLGGLAALCIAAAGLWPAIAAAVTGQVFAYTQTMAAWGGKLRVLIAWPRAFLNLAGTTGLVVFFLMLFCLFGLLARPAARRWGPELWGWAVSYVCYLLLATDFWSTTARHLLLAFPLSLLAVDFLRSMGSRVIRTCLMGLTVCGGLALQWIWIANFLVVTDPGHQFLP